MFADCDTVVYNSVNKYQTATADSLYSVPPPLPLSTVFCREKGEIPVRLQVLAPINGSTSETIITCAASNFSFSHLLWRFNHSQMMVKQSRTDGSSTVSEEWRQQVKDVSESGDITLQDLCSEQEGMYTCQLSNAEETLISDTSVKISGGNSVNGGIIGGVIGAVLVAAAAVGLFLFYKKKRDEEQNSTRTPNITDPLFNV
ncbi:uncharacterized protein LOC127531413 isoform X3 [Acanthochromis polyacanthus]|uniref:uncharacterized protein LOC127531413 isoform X3 n=1 Tax=Acanthochromis polyacanthus TaxID=80966 RepID=UPI002233F21E|nr:uncharacterized protein LOC127531413 isoform X3 [Acanthochromis polyacanthus]